MGRGKSAKGVKAYGAFKIYAEDKAKAQYYADKYGISLSSYINKAVLERVNRDKEVWGIVQ